MHHTPNPNHEHEKESQEVMKNLERWIELTIQRHSSVAQRMVYTKKKFGCLAVNKRLCKANKHQR